jgi:hypothetical protein
MKYILTLLAVMIGVVFGAHLGAVKFRCDGPWERLHERIMHFTKVCGRCGRLHGHCAFSTTGAEATVLQ